MAPSSTTTVDSTLPPADRPEVEVLVDGTWHYGELRMWTQHDDESWSANVVWSRAHGANRLDTFLAETFGRWAAVEW